MPVSHVVKKGESLPGIAELYGFDPESIWNDAANESLRALRKNMNVLLEGDVVVVRDKVVKHVPAATGRLHRYRRKGVPTPFRLQIFDTSGPRKNQEYTLVVDGVELRGRTDDRGVLEQQVPPRAKSGTIVIGPDLFRLTLYFGQLDPVTEPSGIRQRLENLGHRCDEDMSAALRGFQRRFDLSETGEADEATIAKLTELHDSDTTLEA